MAVSAIFQTKIKTIILKRSRFDVRGQNFLSSDDYYNIGEYEDFTSCGRPRFEISSKN